VNLLQNYHLKLQIKYIISAISGGKLHFEHLQISLCAQCTEIREYTTQNLLRITISTVRFNCVFVINMKIDFKELNTSTEKVQGVHDKSIT